MQKIPGTLIAAIKTVPISELSLFFRNLRENRLEQIVGAADTAALLRIQHDVLLIQEFENIFTNMRIS